MNLSTPPLLTHQLAVARLFWGQPLCPPLLVTLRGGIPIVRHPKLHDVVCSRCGGVVPVGSTHAAGHLLSHLDMPPATILGTGSHAHGAKNADVVTGPEWSEGNFSSGGRCAGGLYRDLPNLIEDSMGREQMS